MKEHLKTPPTFQVRSRIFQQNMIFNNLLRIFQLATLSSVSRFVIHIVKRYTCNKELESFFFSFSFQSVFDNFLLPIELFKFCNFRNTRFFDITVEYYLCSLVVCYHLKITAAESHRIFVETYGEQAFGKTECFE